MKKKALQLLCLCFLFFESRSQQPYELLNSWSTHSPIEKVYFHFDRSDYIAGQTIWFKGYLYADFLPATKSTSLYVELLNGSSAIVSRQVLPVFAGFTRGQIELPDTLTGGSYTLRAYTTTMLNHDPDFLYKRAFFIFNKTKTEALAAKPKAAKLEFFPEGGNCIEGLSNSIAFKATDESGLPVAVSGIVKKENGQEVASFSTYHDGMGYFDLVVEVGASYHAVLLNDASQQKYQLPASTRKGVVLRIINIGNGKQFEVLQRKDDPMFSAAYMVGQMQHHVVFKTNLKQNEEEQTGMIKTDNLSSGIMHITVFNKDGMPLAERLTFINNKEYIQQGELLLDTLNFSERAKNRFTLLLKDTVKGSFSVSISDPAYESLPLRQENIFSGLLLTPDIKGYVHNPAYYFSSNTDSVQNALDLVMMTNGWRRFKWNEIVLDSIRRVKYKDPGFIKLAGKINLEGSKKPHPNKEILLLITSADSSRNSILVRTDESGYYEADSLVFFDRARIFFGDIIGRKSMPIDIKQEADSINRSYLLPKIDKDAASISQMMLQNEFARRLSDEYEAMMKENGLMLSEVIVKSQLKTPIQELEEKYTSGAFSGDSRKVFDLVNSDEGDNYRTIWDFLEAKGFSPGRRNMPTISALGDFATDIFLDEFPALPGMLDVLPMNKIAMVKIFSTFVGSWGNGPGGVIAIYTKKDADLWNVVKSPGKVVHSTGYSVIKEFYAPDTQAMKNKTKPDNRITLYWNPLVFVNGVNSSFPIRFYNNDRTKQFKVVIEGMTTDGKMLMIEKLVTPPKPF